MTGAGGYVSAAVRERVARDAGRRCGYCLASQTLLGAPLTVEHIVPRAAGGSSDESNLWLSCRRCNEFKGTQLHAEDPLTDDPVPLFDPRRDRWSEHFAWDEAGIEVVGKTPRGRATVLALQLNNAEIVAARRQWVSVGWWPPRE